VPSQKTIDIHAHIISEETARLMQKEAPKVGPRITPVDADTAMYEVAGAPYRPFPRGGFDLERRFKDMAASEVDMQAVSITPQTFLYDQEAALNATLARIQNEAIAKLTKQQPERFLGLATLPMQAPEQAAAELRHAVRTLGISGGSDYPYDMGTFECVRQVRAASISDADRATILGGQAAAILPGTGQARRATAESWVP
jgi:aminocarboxymuconate-semialdehyde decarboxylase